MVGPWPYRAFTFRALSKTYGQMWLRCDVCRRYARLKLAGLNDVDYRTKTFSCSVCGSEAYLFVAVPRCLATPVINCAAYVRECLLPRLLFDRRAPTAACARVPPS
jgi:hypothetical protein